MDRVLVNKLPFLLPIMMALTSCSSMGNMQSTHALKSPGSSKPAKHVVHHQYKHNKHKKVMVRKTHASHVFTQVAAPKKDTKNIQEPVISSIYSTSKASTPGTLPNPVIGDMYLINVHGIDLDPHLYKKLPGASTVTNLKVMDAMSGHYHYVHVARWDGSHLDEAYINANTAAMMSLIGLGMVENGYIQTKFGSIIMVLSGDGYTVDVPGHPVDIVTHGGKAEKKALKSHKSKPRKIGAPVKKKYMKHSKVKFDSNDFYIVGTNVITVTSKHLRKTSKVVTRIHGVSNKAMVSKHHHKKLQSHVVASKRVVPTAMTFTKKFCGVDKTVINANQPATVTHNLWETHMRTSMISHQMAANEPGGAASNYVTPIYTDSP